ncbi:hypothetical protein BC835DRAFT_1089590 [Cytidiella melzeri]|nr:hypothetical protein BC835DRAFT_1089590 [Cytidiella melzeri]
MPVTRSNTESFNALQLTFRPIPARVQEINPLDYGSSGNKKTNRVVASREQLVTLNMLYRVSCSRVLKKQDYLTASAQTGLTEHWIRKWLSRQKQSRSRSSSTSSSANSDIIHGPLNTGGQYDMFAVASSSPSLQALLTNVSAQSVSALRPDTSRPNSAPDSDDYPNSSQDTLGNDKSYLNYGRTYALLLAKSPSLGYIPSAFRTVDASDRPPSLSSSTSSDSVPEPASSRSSVTQNNYPAVPNLNLSSIAIDSMSTPSMYQLLQAATNVSDESNTQDEIAFEPILPSPLQPTFLAGGLKSNHMLSFAPSLQSHSTSVMFNHTARPSLSQSMPFQPLPVAYKTRLSDLSALAKRVKSVSVDEFFAAIRTEESITEDEFSLGSILSSQSISDDSGDRADGVSMDIPRSALPDGDTSAESSENASFEE